MMEETVEALMDGVATTVGAILEEETGEPVTKETAEDTRVLPTLVATEEGFVPAISIDDIKVGKRYRKELGDIPSLMESIARTGLLHPVVVVTTGSEHTLAAGRRRL